VLSNFIHYHPPFIAQCVVTLDRVNVASTIAASHYIQTVAKATGTDCVTWRTDGSDERPTIGARIVSAKDAM